MSSRLILIIGLLVSSAALAQVDANNGIKIGDGRLHPYLDLEGRYDSAVAYRNGTELKGDIALRVRPGLIFELLGTDNIVHFNGNAEYVFYPGLFDSVTRQASRFQTDVGLDAAFNKTGAVEFQIGDQLLRSDRTSNAALTIGALSLYNNVRIAVPIHPGGGALEFSPKASWAVEFFSPLVNSTTDLSVLNYSNLNVGLGARWRFLPKTAVVFDGTFDYRTYFNVPGVPADLMKLQLGLAGLISSKISLLILAGYGRDFARAQAASTFIGQAEIGVLLSDLITFKGGYVRTIQPVPVYGTYGDDRGYLEAKVTVSRFSLLGTAAVDYLTFSPILAGAPRADIAFSLGIAPAFRIFSWWSISAAYNLTLRTSNATVAVGTTPPSFTRHEAILQLHFSY